MCSTLISNARLCRGNMDSWPLKKPIFAKNARDLVSHVIYVSNQRRAIFFACNILFATHGYLATKNRKAPKPLFLYKRVDRCFCGPILYGIRGSRLVLACLVHVLSRQQERTLVSNSPE